MRAGDQRFEGEIGAAGTTSGTRVVVGRWTTSPFGAFADVMVERADGRRTLLAPNDDVAGYLVRLYRFDEVVIGPVDAERSDGRLVVAAGSLAADVTIGARDALGWALRAVPRRLAASPAWATLVDPVARVTLRGVRTRGTTAVGREWYGARDRRHVLAVRASWDGVDLGPLANVHPPVRFGFSSAPRRPSIVTVTTTVRPR